MKRRVLILLLLLVSTISYSQHLSPIFKNLNIELPSSEVHDIYQDTIGYIWFATDRGIGRFDGNNTITINTQPHFSTSVYKFFKETNKKFGLTQETMNYIGLILPIINLRYTHTFIMTP